MFSVLCVIIQLTAAELQHLIWSASFNGVLNLCPLPEPMTDALDVGCGTGCTQISGFVVKFLLC